MFRKLFLALSLVFTACLVHAQTTISASDVSDSFDHPIAAAKLCFAPVDATGSATGFRSGSTQVVTTPVCGLVSNGVLQSGLTVVPTPSGVYYHITAVNRSSNAVIRDYGMTPITGSSWTLDTYDPSTAVLPVTAITMGTVTTLPSGSSAYCSLSGGSPLLLNCGIPSGEPGINWRGTWTATTAYAKGDGFGEGENAYIVSTAYTSGASFGSTDTANTVEISTVNGQAITPSSINTAHFYCTAGANPATCIAAAEAYAVSGHAAIVEFSDATYTISSPITLTSGIKIEGVVPRLVDCSPNFASCESPNGGTWFSCTTGCFYTPGSTGYGVNNDSIEDVSFEGWTGNAIQFGTSATVGLNNGYLHNVTFYGVPEPGGTNGPSDKGFVCYNCQIVAKDNVTGINMNTIVWEQGTCCGSIGGNAVSSGVAVQTYEKSVANGNSTEPGMYLGLNNDLYIRPQVNTYGGDGTATGIYLAGENHTLLGVDVEIYGLYGVDDEGEFDYVEYQQALPNAANTDQLRVGVGATGGTYIEHMEFGCISIASGNTIVGWYAFGGWQVCSDSAGTPYGFYGNNVLTANAISTQEIDSPGTLRIHPTSGMTIGPDSGDNGALNWVPGVGLVPVYANEFQIGRVLSNDAIYSIFSDQYEGPTTAPTGGCSPNGSRAWSQDGKESICEGAWEIVPQDVQITTGTGAVSATCASNTISSAVTMAGLTTSYGLNFTPTTDLSSVAGWENGDIYFVPVLSGGSFQWRLCTSNSSGETPGSSVTWNVSAK